MGDIFKQLGIFLLSALKQLDWKAVIYKLCNGTILPALKKKVDASTSKVDDVIYAGLERLVDSFLAPTPSAPKALAALEAQKALVKPA